MKKMLTAMLAVLLAVTLCACGGEKKTGTRSVLFYGKGYTIDYDNRTISDGETTCQYSMSGGNLTLTYPDGEVYRQGSGTGDHWSQSLDFCAVLQAQAEDPGRGSELGWASVLLWLLFVAVGVFDTAFPEKAWYWSYGWRFKDAEPSDAALTAARVGGVLLMALGIFGLLFLR